MNSRLTFRYLLMILAGSAFLLTQTMCSKKSDDNNDTTPAITVTDVDGNVYHGVTIGTQVWMLENLKVTKYRNGDAIANVTDTSVWNHLTTGAYCWYGNDATNKDTYGALYNWFAVTDTRNIAPTGWHIATDAEWTTLTTYLGGTDAAGGKLKEAGITHWSSPNTGGTNQSGFTALPCGQRIEGGSYSGLHTYADFWSVTAFSSTLAWIRELNSQDAVAYRYIALTVNGCSVRCVKD